MGRGGLHWVALHCTAERCVALVTLNCIGLHSNALRCNALGCIAMGCTATPSLSCSRLAWGSVEWGQGKGKTVCRRDVGGEMIAGVVNMDALCWAAARLHCFLLCYIAMVCVTFAPMVLRSSCD